ncbi:Gfo/Idh/MocA family oxidoreductase [Stieleria sp. JC731]|uniref:Gfo/Idh/MocA family protein n=1 Tax=Pirellulaceae TaxID=2691357 RepID=UPI001E57E31D|nr:Gfo/Idh/MocA family oxidoreductase [Stieleria sp. JC731]MCC9599020.1 Gfo/Idh/MocA family oxidoreductase [Stieleria sp. JC731]
MRLRVGLIGLGEQWQSRYRPALRMLDDRFDVRAVYSTISKLAESTAEEFQADPIDGYRSLVYRCDIDAVLILKQCWLGWLPALAACQAGKAVYWGAGLDFDPVGQKSVRQTIESSGVAFMAELPRRFAPATLRMKELIATHLGAPRLIRVHRQAICSDNSPHPGPATCRTDDSELVELVDWCRYIVGRSPTAVSSVCKEDLFQSLILNYDQQDSGCRTTKDGADQSKVDRGAIAEIATDSTLPVQWKEAASFRSPAAMKVQCENGVAFIDLPSNLVWFDDAGRHVESLETESPVGERMLRQFHRSVTSLVRDLTGLVDAYEAAAVVQAARQSHETGCRVPLPA